VSLRRYVALTTAAAAGEPLDLVVWPENSMDFFVQEESPEQELLLRTAHASGADLVLGAMSYAHGVRGVRYHNSVFLVRDGVFAGRYDKRRLLPFVEADLLPDLLPAIQPVEPGRHLNGLRARRALLGATVCVESMHPEHVRLVARDADLLVNVSNDAWFAHEAAARHHLAVASLRAVENRRWLVFASASGFAAVVDPYGRMAAQSGFGVPEAVTAHVAGNRIRTPYQRWGDAGAWLALAGAAIVPFTRKRRRGT
jgi:apolipoprotein N-acyltransferase